MRLPVDSATQRALSVSENTILRLRAGVDRKLVRSYVAGLAHRFNRTVRNANLVLHGLKPYVTKSRDGRALHQRVIANAIATEIAEGTREPITLTAKTIKPKTTEKAIGPVIVIQRGSNVLTLYRRTHEVRQFRVATGQAIYPTPLGRFEIVVMWKNPWWYPPNDPWAAGEKPTPPGPGNPLGTRWMGLSSPGVGIHGTPESGSIGYSRVARLHPHAHPAGGVAVRPRHRRHTRLHRLRVSHVPHAQAVRPGDRARRRRRDARGCSSGG